MNQSVQQENGAFNAEAARNGYQHKVSSPKVQSDALLQQAENLAKVKEANTFSKPEPATDSQNALEHIPDWTHTNGKILPAQPIHKRGGDGQSQDSGTGKAQEKITSSIQQEDSSSSFNDDSFQSDSESEITPIQAYAKLEFDDSELYMHTYSIELGRDAPLVGNANHYGVTTPSSIDAISERGGIIGVNVEEVVQNGNGTRIPTNSTSSPSRNHSRNGSAQKDPSNGHTSYSALNGAYHAHDLDLPSPDLCPLIPIHPPARAEGDRPGHRAISRRHVKIAYNFEKRLFELHILGKNGAFLDEHHYKAGEVHELRSGSHIQISGVCIRFLLPDVEVGETGAEGTTGSEPASGGAMSFDFEDGRGESGIMADTSQSSLDGDGGSEQDRRGRPRRRGGKYRLEEPRKEIRKLRSVSARGGLRRQYEGSESDDVGDDEESDNDGNDDDGEEEGGGDEEDVRNATKQRKGRKKLIQAKAKGKTKIKVEPPPPTVKRKGPGRPPKNGVISKREQALLAKQAREAAQANAPAKASKGDKAKVSKTIEGSEQADGPINVKPEKRKYTKRKKVKALPEEQDDARQMTEKTESLPPEQVQVPAPRPPKRAPKRSRSPSPVYDASKLTEEQMAKPSQSYVILIHEALSNSPTGQMSLSQIYHAIERKYPYYKVKVTTLGWQSSVRHNLSQNSAFRKIERDGKGWMWGLVPGVSIEKKEKPRRLSPVANPAPRQTFYPTTMPYYGLPGPYSLPQHAPMHHMPPIQLPNYRGPPHGLPLALPIAPLDGTNTTYRSPYDPDPAPSISLPPSGPVHAPTNPLLPIEPRQGPSLPTAPPPNPETIYSKPPLPPKPSPTPNPPVRTPAPIPDILDRVSKFKAELLKSMSKWPDREQIVSNAVNRWLRQIGIANDHDVPEPIQELPYDRQIMLRLQSMYDQLVEQRAGSNTPGPPMRVQTPIMQSENEAPEHGTVGWNLTDRERKAENGERGMAKVSGEVSGKENGVENGAAEGEAVSVNGHASNVNGGDEVEENRGLKRTLDDGDVEEEEQRQSKRVA